MELPIDHFRLIGVSPSAEAEAILRTLQLRLDRPPQQGFTQEALANRAELLRLSADLLTDLQRRQEYETALLGGASGLEISSNMELAGLMLLWEADASLEAFRIASNCLHPPQAPALGSGREADLTLVTALSCRSAAGIEREQRNYETAAGLLQEGIQILQRMGKLPEERENLLKDLELLLPYRILDLVSRDLGDQTSRQEGIRLLDEFVFQRGGLDGENTSTLIGGLSQSDFERFFQQIRNYLTVQEQVDLFSDWQRQGSQDAGFLCAIALIADGFSRRKPERIHEARQYLKGIKLKGLDKLPLLGCLDLLLADVDLSHERFRNSPDDTLQNWLKNHQGTPLEALCQYSRDWLRRDVLRGYRDVDADETDLEGWFADRDVQAYIERLDWKGPRGIAKAGFSFLSSLSAEADSESSTEAPEVTVQDEDQLIEDKERSESDKDELIRDFGSSSNHNNIFPFLDFNLLNKLEPNTRKVFNFVFASVTIIIALFGLRSIFDNRIKPSAEIVTIEEKVPDRESDIEMSQDEAIKPVIIDIKNDFAGLTVLKPTKDDLIFFLESWLFNKAQVLSGGKSDSLSILARPGVLQNLKKERDKDKSLGRIQNIEASVDSLQVVSVSSKRIEFKARLTYRDKTIDSSGKVISESFIPRLFVTYILGRDGDNWRLHHYVSGS